MNSDELLFQQYKLYTEQKDTFVERSFATNKFYLVLVLVMLVVVFLTQDINFHNKVNLSLVLCIAGAALSALWWLNMDSYNFLIKMKFSKVIQEIEKSLPGQPYEMEYQAIIDYRKNKKMFLFSDIQKALALLSFLLYFVLLMIELVPMLAS